MKSSLLYFLQRQAGDKELCRPVKPVGTLKSFAKKDYIGLQRDYEASNSVVKVSRGHMAEVKAHQQAHQAGPVAGQKCLKFIRRELQKDIEACNSNMILYTPVILINELREQESCIKEEMAGKIARSKARKQARFLERIRKLQRRQWVSILPEEGDDEVEVDQIESSEDDVVANEPQEERPRVTARPKVKSLRRSARLAGTFNSLVFHLL